MAGLVKKHIAVVDEKENISDFYENCMLHEMPMLTGDPKCGLYMNKKTGNLVWLKRRSKEQFWCHKTSRFGNGYYYHFIDQNHDATKVLITKKAQRSIFYIGKV